MKRRGKGCGDGYCKNASKKCVSASGLTCPSDTTASCYKNETSTVSSGDCLKSCTYKVANTPNCGSNAHVTGSGTSCSCECNSGYSGNPFSGCSLSCAPLANESSNSSTCKTTSYSCPDGCGGTRTCYKSACTGSQVCYNKSCCTPNWPSYQGYDYNNCMTSSDGTVSDGCGNTTTKYKSACTGSQICKNGSCVKNDDTICYDDCYADCEDAFDNCISDWRYRNLNHMTIDDCYDEEQDCRDYCDDTYDQRNAGCTKVIILEDEKD